MSTAQRHPKLVPVAPIVLAAGAACVVAAVWALWPIPASPVTSPEEVLAAIQTPADAPTLAASGFDAAAFHTPLWVAVAPEPEQFPDPPPPAPPPLRATLLAIARDASHAIFHNQDADSIATLRVGDQIQGRLVTRIEPSRVTLTLEGRPQMLDLGYEVGAARSEPARRDAAATPSQEGAP